MRKKKRKFKKWILVCFLLGIAVLTKITSNVVLKVQKDQITINIQDMERRIDELSRENTSLKLEIQNLQNKEIIFDKMKDEGFTVNLDNVIYISE